MSHVIISDDIIRILPAASNTKSSQLLPHVSASRLLQHSDQLQLGEGEPDLVRAARDGVVVLQTIWKQVMKSFINGSPLTFAESLDPFLGSGADPADVDAVDGDDDNDGDDEDGGDHRDVHRARVS